MKLGGLVVARILGIPLRLDWSWFVVLLLLTWTFATFAIPSRAPGLVSELYWMLGFTAALLLFLSVLIHELAHALTARRRGIPVERITLFIFGGVAEMRMEARRPLDEFVLTIVGPLASLALAGMFWGLEAGAAALGGEATALLAGTLASLNLILAVFNMIPAFPLDGGRVLRSALWQFTGSLTRATRWAAGVGRVFGWLLIAWGAWLFLVVDARLAGVWAVFLGWFLAGAAGGAVRESRRRSLHASLEQYPVTAALGPATPAVSEAATVAELVEELLQSGRGEARLVVRAAAPVGAVTLAAASDVPTAERAQTRVLEIMTPLDELPRLGRDASLASAASALDGFDGRPAIVEDDQDLHVLTAVDIERWMERRETLDG